MLLDFEGIDKVIKKKRPHRTTICNKVYHKIIYDAYEKITAQICRANEFKYYDDQVEAIHLINHFYDECVSLNVFPPVNGGMLEKLDRIAEYAAEYEAEYAA